MFRNFEFSSDRKLLSCAAEMLESSLIQMSHSLATPLISGVASIIAQEIVTFLFESVNTLHLYRLNRMNNSSSGANSIPERSVNICSVCLRAFVFIACWNLPQLPTYFAIFRESLAMARCAVAANLQHTVDVLRSRANVIPNASASVSWTEQLAVTRISSFLIPSSRRQRPPSYSVSLPSSTSTHWVCKTSRQVPCIHLVNFNPTF